MPACMPVTWNIGSALSVTVPPSVAPRQRRYTDAVAWTLLWVCMQPFGLPVVPEV